MQANYRSAYDILVRPAGSRTQLERSDRLVQQNFLSGIYGGITMHQYHQVQQIPGVAVAAPVAMIGYLMPFENLWIPAARYITPGQNTLLRLRVTEAGDDGLSSYPGPDFYVFVNHGKSATPIAGPDSTCSRFYSRLPFKSSAFDLPASTALWCFSVDPPAKHQGRIAFKTSVTFPVLLAAINPVQEAKLVGLDKAMVSGRYLTAADRTRTLKEPGSFAIHQVPVMAADHPLTQAPLTVRVQRMRVTDPSTIPAELASRHPLRWLAGLPATTLRTSELTNTNQYHRMLRVYGASSGGVNAQFWSVGPPKYHRQSDGHLRVQPVANGDPALWLNPELGYYAPQSDRDISFRHLRVHYEDNHIVNNVANFPSIHLVGVFDPDKIRGFSPLSKVPLTTYNAPDAAPGDPRTSRLLHGRPLAPDNNLAGYLQQPPMLLTTIRSLHSFTDPHAFGNIAAFAKAPISVIRVRVSGVTGVDPLSQARVRLAAERIARQTGLDVDITMGSSPHQELIDLPAGHFGRPPLVLSEGWVKKGVAVALLSAVNTKSLALFALVLLVCLLFLINATVAAVRTRRTELGVLACLGWPARRIFGLLEAELAATGFAAGLLGTLIAAILATSTGLHVSWLQIGLITPVAVLLCVLAGIGPTWRACHATPLQAITPAVRAPRKPAKVTSVTRLAVVGLRRWPGRTILGGASLFVGVAALTALIAIQQAFQGRVVGTTMGNVVAIEVRGITERHTEIGTLRSTGWADRHVRRLFGTEGLLTSATGAILGAALSVTATALLLPVDLTQATQAAAIAAGIGITAAMIALLIPLTRLAGLAPANAINDE